MGGDIINHPGGYGVFKRDEFDIVDFKSNHKLVISFTGLEIEELKRSLVPENCNPNNTKTKVPEYLESIRITPSVT